MPDTVLITGGTGGLGAAVTQAFLDGGWNAVVPWIAERELERVQERDGLTLVQADLFDEADARRVADAAQPRALVNLVGGFAAGQPVADTAYDEFEAQLRLNLRPTYLVTQAAWPHLAREGGAVVCVSSRAALKPFAGAAGYCSAKAAVIALTQVMAEEGRRDGIRCNAILPSVIDTPANREAMGADAKMVAPADIAKVVRALCEDTTTPVTGAAIPVYGDA